MQTKGDHDPTTLTATGGPVLGLPLLQSLEMLFFRTKQQDDHALLYPVSSRPHAVPLHRTLSYDVKFCSWLGQEGYFQVLVTVNPAALEGDDELESCEERRLGIVVSYVAHVSAHGCW